MRPSAITQRITYIELHEVKRNHTRNYLHGYISRSGNCTKNYLVSYVRPSAITQIITLQLREAQRNFTNNYFAVTSSITALSQSSRDRGPYLSWAEECPQLVSGTDGSGPEMACDWLQFSSQYEPQTVRREARSEAAACPLVCARAGS